jgi:C1A family cysteine protease
MNNRKFSWRPDVPDFRDFRLSKILKPKMQILPKSVYLNKYCTTIEDQGDLGSCTANALVGAMEFLHSFKTKKELNLSRLFVYYNERVIEGTVNQDAGAMLRDGIKTLVAQGVCLEKTCPYVTSAFKRKPSAKAYTEALNYQALQYARLNTLADMQRSLANNFPFVFGFAVYESFMTDAVAKTGVAIMPIKGESMLGGHAVMAVGYDDSRKALLVRNSWGTNWGIRGYFWMPYDYVTNRNLSDDFWAITAAEGL